MFCENVTDIIILLRPRLKSRNLRALLSLSACLSPSLVPFPILPLISPHFGPCCVWSRPLSSLSLHEAAEIWRSVDIPLMVPLYKRVGNGLKCRVNPGQIMPIDHYKLFLQKIKWSARDNLLFHLILLC